ncbi:MAG: histidinol-phosphate transaminase [Proteobacteria bacterium]|nr:histidinol-phosphate transaminase [Pseudomonadota bacterium]MDA0994333.1 histidinol-phosphate transaminase [Pseudomonadota bacterium]
MRTVSRRHVLMGGGALLGSSMLPRIGLIEEAFGEEFPRPDYMIRAGWNENPWGPSRVALQAIVDSIKMSNLYGGNRRALTDLMGTIHNLPTDHISIGTGSGEILRTAGMLASVDKGSVVCADPTYHDLIRYAETAGSKIIRVPVNPETLHVDLNAMHKAIRKDTKCVYIANPNNPIPSIIEKNALREFTLDVSKDRMVFIDEAYFEFVDNPDYESLMDLVRDGHKNIVVARTASKIHGLAGMRIGFGFAHPELTGQINDAKTGAINVLGLNAAYASYQDQDFQEFTVRRNKESLSIVETMLDELGHRYVKSNANFSFIYTGRDINEVNQAFKAENILVGRPFPPMTDWVRVSMAKPHEMEYFAQVYRKILG